MVVNLWQQVLVDNELTDLPRYYTTTGTCNAAQTDGREGETVMARAGGSTASVGGRLGLVCGCRQHEATRGRTGQTARRRPGNHLALFGSRTY